MNRARREARKKLDEYLKQQRVTLTKRAQEERARQAAAVQTELARRRKRREVDDVPSQLRTVLESRAPKVLCLEFTSALRTICTYEWVRPIDTWKPEGKSRESLFRSLLEHLLSRYRTPKFLWSVFLQGPVESWVTESVVHIAKGGSLYDKVLSGEFTVPFTRKMCHDFLQTTSEFTFLSGIRRTQVRAYGGSPQLFRTWMTTQIGGSWHSKQREEFWATVLQFFAKNPMMDHQQIGPLLDYIQHRRVRERDFSMKGRSVVALMRAMTEWHGDLAKENVLKGQNFESSGFKSGEYEMIYRERSGHLRILWEIREILSSKELATEGREMHHCVYSYASRIGPDRTSIWTLKGNGQRAVTIQVENKPQLITQFRGKFNAVPSAREFQVLKTWADANGLKFGRLGW